MKSKLILLLFVVALSLGLVLGVSELKTASITALKEELLTPPAEESVTSSAKPLRNNNRDLWYHPTRGWSSSSGKSGKSGSKSTSHPTLFPTLSPTLYPTMYPTLSPTYCGKSGKSGGGGKSGKSCGSSWSSSSWDWRGVTRDTPYQLLPAKRTEPSPSPPEETTKALDISTWGADLAEEDGDTEDNEEDPDDFAKAWLKLTGGEPEAADEEEDSGIDLSDWADALGGGGGDRDLKQDNSMLRRRINGGEQAVVAEQEP
eukprot:224305_1